MEIRVKRSQLLNELVPMQGIVERRTTIPVLSHILMQVEGDKLHLAATDLDVSLTTSCEAEVGGEGGIAVQARKFLEIIRAVVGDEVKLELEDEKRLSITAGNSRFKINGLSPEDFPTLPDVKEEDGVSVELKPGQASMHHGHLFHASGPNTTGDRRIGSAIRYIKTSMKQQTGDRSLVALVAGEDTYGHFTIAGPPRGRLAEEDFDLCRADTEIKRRVLYEGAEDAKGTRY